MTWSNGTKKWYEDKGYVFTGNGEELFVKVRDLPHGSNKKVQCKCDYCGKITKISYEGYLDNTENETIKYACKSCVGQKNMEYWSDERREKYYNQFVDLCLDRNYTPISTLEDYKNERTKLKYLCPKHGIHESSLSNFRRHGCSDCGHEIINKKNTLSKEKVKEIVESKNNNKLLNVDEYDKAKTPNLKIRCGSCGKVFITSLESIIVSDGACLECGYIKTGQALKNNINDVIARIESKNNNILLNPDEYIDARTNNLKVQCGSCGKIFTTSLTNYDRNITGRCPECNTNSFGEHLISLFLDEYNIQYDHWHVFKDCKDINSMPFDFYLPDYNLCIEFDGEQHYYPGFGMESFLKTILHDGMKNNYCRWNNIDLLRIPYYDIKHINDILIKKLNLI